MIRAIEEGGDFACNEKLISHVIEIMEKCDLSAKNNQYMEIR